MSVGRIVGCDDYKWIGPKDRSMWRYFRQCDGRVIDPPSDIIGMNMFSDIGAKRIADFPHLSSHIPVVSERAIGVVGEFLQGNTQLIPLIDQHRSMYYAVNVRMIVDALDYDRSEVIRFDSGRVMDIPHLVLIEERVRDVHLFKIPELLLMDIFVSQRFCETAWNAGLTGLCVDDVEVS